MGGGESSVAWLVAGKQGEGGGGGGGGKERGKLQQGVNDGMREKKRKL